MIEIEIAFSSPILHDVKKFFIARLENMPTFNQVKKESLSNFTSFAQLQISFPSSSGRLFSVLLFVLSFLVR
jgi:hypothetical protein